MIENDFKLEHNEGILTAIITTEGKTLELDVTSYFDTEEITMEWMFYKRKQRLSEK